MPFSLEPQKVPLSLADVLFLFFFRPIMQIRSSKLARNDRTSAHICKLSVMAINLISDLPYV